MTSLFVKNPFFEVADSVAKILVERTSYRKYQFDVLSFFSNFNLVELLWDKQRPINENVKMSIIEYLSNLDKDSGRRMSNMNVTVATINGSDPKIIDGQHRLAAIENMDRDDCFFVDVIDFMDENQRFLQFININSNTPLPSIYKSVTDHDSFCKSVSELTARKLVRKYPTLVSEVKKPYYMNKDDIKEYIFEYLRKYNVTMCDLKTIRNDIVDATQDKNIFPRIRCHYKNENVLINKDVCLSQKTEKEKYIQCHRLPKENGYCGYHKMMKYPFNPVLVKTKRFGEIITEEKMLRSDGSLAKEESLFFIMDPEWPATIIRHLFPLY